MVPVIAMYCEIAKEEIQQDDGIREVLFNGLDATKDLNYNKIPVDVQKKYLSEKF